MRALVREAGLEERIELDSAGTGGWHVGSPPDERATAAAAARGIALEGSARQVRPEGLPRISISSLRWTARTCASFGDWRPARRRAPR